MIKRILCLLMTAVLLISMAACTSGKTADVTDTGTPENEETVTPVVELPKYENETVELNNINDYTIVYPSDYTDLRKKDVEFLQKTIKEVTGASLNIISDLEDTSGKEIIIASSKRKNGVEDALEKLPHGLDYVVAVRNGNIVLGGNNYYADIRAIYDFINNTLGYDDVDDKHGETKETISDVTYNLYNEPEFLFMASNSCVPAFTEQHAIRDMAEAHFNMTFVWEYLYETDEQLHNFVKWCARYCIFIIMSQSNGYNTELYWDCPVIWGHYVSDEPTVDKFASVHEKCDEYVQKFGKYGWKPYININAPVEKWTPQCEWLGLFDSVPMVSVDLYWGHSILKDGWTPFRVFEEVRRVAKLTKRDLWSYIETYNITNQKQNTSKKIRWDCYISLCYGAKNIQYFQYGDASRLHTSEGDWSFGSLVNEDYTKNQAWFDAKNANEEILRIAPIYNQYESEGVLIYNAEYTEGDTDMQSPYNDMSKYIVDFAEENGARDPYLFGFFDKIGNNDSRAFILVNLEDLNDKHYEMDEARHVKIKINGENVKFYKDGYIQNVDKDNDGYYTVDIKNGYCWFVTID